MIRWLLGAIIMLCVGLVYGLMTGEARIDDVETNIRGALTEAGYDWASVEMSGNQAHISGTAPSVAAQQSALSVAEATRCTGCKLKHKWHSVRDGTQIVPIAALPTQSPYVFSARKSVDGNVTLDGFVPSEAVRGDVLQDAVDVFGNDRVTDDLQLADGAPDGRWADVIKLYFRRLAQLDSGRLSLEGYEGSLIGAASDGGVQTSLYDAMGTTMIDGYNFVGNVRVQGAPVSVFGRSQSQSICQGLMNDLRRGRKVQFEAGDAVIQGAPNIALLNDLASAANQCPGFQIAVHGYTSSEGDPAMNQTLSEARAMAVMNYLSNDGGIDLSRLSARGFGADNPVASNATEDGREQNCRIEFILTRAE